MCYKCCLYVRKTTVYNKLENKFFLNAIFTLNTSKAISGFRTWLEPLCFYDSVTEHKSFIKLKISRLEKDKGTDAATQQNFDRYIRG